MVGAVARRGIIGGINVTPLVDIMLVLLVVFMVTAKVTTQPSLDLQLPHADGRGGAAAAPPRQLELAADGSLSVEGKPLLAAALPALIAGWLAERGKQDDVQVLIAADGRVPHAQVVALMALLGQQGVRQIAFAIAPNEAP